MFAQLYKWSGLCAAGISIFKTFGSSSTHVSYDNTPNEFSMNNVMRIMNMHNLCLVFVTSSLLKKTFHLTSPFSQDVLPSNASASFFAYFQRARSLKRVPSERFKTSIKALSATSRSRRDSIQHHQDNMKSYIMILCIEESLINTYIIFNFFSLFFVILVFFWWCIII